MKAILGIGNPGREYEHTRHNAGFDVVDILLGRTGLDWQRNKKWETLIAQWRVPGLHDSEDDKVLLLKPQTYVNLSGKTAQAVCAYYKLRPADLLVVVDDINLGLGDLRLRAQGSSGGHNGLKDIERRIGKAYPRLRLGIGSPRGDQTGHVLGRFAPDELADVRDMLSKASDCCACWLHEGVEPAMRFNGPLRPPPPKPKPGPAEEASTPAVDKESAEDHDAQR